MFLVIKKRNIVIFIIILLLFSMCLVSINSTKTASVYFGASGRKLPIYSVSTKEKVVALTFDAAWGADKTKKIIEILNKFEAKATFFLVGFWVQKYSDEVKNIDASGFEIGNHSNNHLKMSTITEEEIKKEINTVNDVIKEITGKMPKFFRPPYGDYSNTLITVLDELKMKTIQWDVDSLDWKGLSGNEIVNRVVTKVKNGSIVLFHNNSDNILDALPTVLLNLKNNGYRFLTLSEMVYDADYYIDNNGLQIKK